jgi:hypothetical protein
MTIWEWVALAVAIGAAGYAIWNWWVLRQERKRRDAAAIQRSIDRDLVRCREASRMPWEEARRSLGIPDDQRAYEATALTLTREIEADEREGV